MKKGIGSVAVTLLAAGVLAVGMLAGCGQGGAQGSSASTDKAAAVNAFTAENEIATYEKIDPQRTQLVVSRTGNIELREFCEEFEARNPDVQIIYLDITGGNSTTVPAVDWVKNGYAPDVMFSTAGFFSAENTEEYFENLSASPLIENYEIDALRRTATNANVYWLPGPSNINCIAYNKTLFAEHGWQVPRTFDEFVALCLQIRADTNGAVEPWNPNAKYSDELQIATEAFVYEEVFGGASNRAWYNDVLEGSAVLAGHMEPYYKMLQTLVDNGLLREEHFSYSATTRGKEFGSGKIAMINTPISEFDNDAYDFGYMPFPTTKGETGYVCDAYSCFVGVPQKDHGQQEQDALDRFLEFFSTAEGQQVFIGDTLKMSNVKDVPLSESDDLVALQSAIDAGHTFDMLNFKSEKRAVGVSLYQDALAMATGTKGAAKCLAAADEALAIAVAEAAKGQPGGNEAADEQPEVVATATQDMTILETSFYLADAYREAADADIGLIANNVAFRGNLMRIFAGDLTTSFVSVLKPRSFENGSTLAKVSMTGQQLLDALNAPVDYDEGVANCIYAYSGLVCEVAPWNELGQKYLSVKLADGSNVDLGKKYTVAIWSGTVADEHIAEVLETYEGTFEDMLAAKMKSEGTVAPANDGRIKLVWEGAS